MWLFVAYVLWIIGIIIKVLPCSHDLLKSFSLVCNLEYFFFITQLSWEGASKVIEGDVILILTTEAPDKILVASLGKEQQKNKDTTKPVDGVKSDNQWMIPIIWE